MSYSEKVLDHYENPRNVGSFSKDDDNVGVGLVGAPPPGYHWQDMVDPQTGVHKIVAVPN
jgi:nitrogen fixation protein NifU and related proteins